MMLSLLLVAGLWMAPGEIYRCTDAGGSVRFQDQPCAGGHSQRLAGGAADSAASQRALQRWLDAHSERPPAPAQPASTPVPARLPGPVSEAQLAACSERFLQCAQGDAPAMDACIAALPRCEGAAAAGCCPALCISRYQSLRGQGLPLAESVRLALVDRRAPACTAPRAE